MKVACSLILLGLISSTLHAASLDEARRLTDTRDYSAAIDQFNALLVKTPDNADLLIEAARVNGWADRNAEASRLYQEALRVDPGRLQDIRGSLAWQLHWSGQSERALPYFSEELMAKPDDREIRHGMAEVLIAMNRLPEALQVYREQETRFPHDQKATRGQARVLMWLDRHEEARAAYEAILVRLPADREARLGMARIANLKGRHQSAAQQLKNLLKEGADDQVRLELARALRWSGDDFASFKALDAMKGSEAHELRLQVQNSLKHHVEINAEFSNDSDDLDIQVYTARLGIHAGEKSGFHFIVRHARLEQNKDELDGRTLLVGYDTVLGEAGGKYGLVFPSLYLGLRDYVNWNSPAWTGRLKWLPADDWRWDFEAGNSLIENVQSICNHVRFDYLSGGFDYRFSSPWLSSLGLMAGRFDDGNRRTRLNGRLEYKFNNKPMVVMGLEGMGFQDSDPPVPGRGYWSPDSYREFKLAARVEGSKSGWDYLLKAALGKLWEEPGNSHNLYQLEAWLLHRLDDWGSVRIYGGYSDSAALTQGSGGGYSRGYYGITLDIPF
ncbi:MAG: tetratricopeptide repeat protein [Hydrogenophilaceae bacterium]|nr:tetratricopeptide repeat protein [Hydrogenophilaceae bacterium]